MVKSENMINFMKYHKKGVWALLQVRGRARGRAARERGAALVLSRLPVQGRTVHFAVYCT